MQQQSEAMDSSAGDVAAWITRHEWLLWISAAVLVEQNCDVKNCDVTVMKYDEMMRRDEVQSVASHPTAMLFRSSELFLFYAACCAAAM